MNKKPAQGGRRLPVLTTNDYGQPIVLVPLANHSRPARIDAKDFEMLLADGYSDQWNFNRVGQAYGYVRCKNGKIKGGLSTVARLVLGAGEKKVVHYRDGDRLNLCRSNLYITKGNASGATPCPGPTSGPCGVPTVG